MGIDQFPAASSGISSVVRSIQRGVAASSGNVTISSVDVDKTQVTSFSTGAAGSAAINGTLELNQTPNNSPSVTTSAVPSTAHTGGPRYGHHTYATVFSGPRTISGGTSTLTAAAHGAYLSNATTLVVTGPCRYEIVEYV